MSVMTCWNPLDYQCGYACRYCPERDHSPNPVLRESWSRFPLKKRGSEAWSVCCDTDLFHPRIPSRIISEVMELSRLEGKTHETCVFNTKNPSRLTEFIDEFPGYYPHFAVTVESDIDYGYTLAHPPLERLEALRDFIFSYSRGEFILSVKPIMRFTDGFARAIMGSGVNQVGIGRDAVGFRGFPTPPIGEAVELAKTLAGAGILVNIEGVKISEDSSRRTRWPRIDCEVDNKRFLRRTVKF